MDSQNSTQPKSAWRHREAQARKLGSALLPVFDGVEVTRIREASDLLEVVKEWSIAGMDLAMAEDMLDQQMMNDSLRDEMLRDARSDAGYSDVIIEEDEEYDRYEYEHRHIKSLEDDVKTVEGKILSLCRSNFTVVGVTVDDLTRLRNRLDDYIQIIQTQLNKIRVENN